MSANKEQNLYSPSQSRVSSSSSSQSQTYELIPKDDAFFNLQRDFPSPKASFPFKRVQGSYQASKINQNGNQLKQEQDVTSRVVANAEESIQAVREASNTKKKEEAGDIKQKTTHEQQLVRIQEKQKIIIQLQTQIQQQRVANELQRKANQIYAQAFGRIRELIQTKTGEQLQGEAVEQLVQRLAELLNAKGSEFVIIEEQEEKIRELRAELLKSSQNNINAIFNTEITETHCLQLQIKKMNSEIAVLKQNIAKVTAQSQQCHSKAINKLIIEEGRKTRRVYEHKRSDCEEDINRYHKHLHKGKRRESRQSSSSSGQKRSKRLVSTQSKIGQLIEGYKLLRDEYKILESAILQMSGSQTDFKELFSTLRKQITGSIRNQIREVNDGLKGTCNNHEQLKVAKDLELKLNHLVNTLNAPEKVNAQMPVEDERDSWKNVECVRKIAQLQSHAAQLEKEVRGLQGQKLALEEAVGNLASVYQGQRKQHSKVADQGYLSPNKMTVDNYPPKQQTSPFTKIYLKDRDMQKQMPSLQRSLNKLQASQSYHESSKRSEVDGLYQRLAKYEDIIRQKQHRITELQDVIIDHIESKTSTEFALSGSELKERYELYINNLKMLLAEARRENQFIKRQLFKASQMSLSRANNAAYRHSLAATERTTKNGAANYDSSPQQRQNKMNNFESIKARIQVEDALEKAFFVLLHLCEKVSVGQVERITLGSAVSNCLSEVILQSKQRRSILYEETMQKAEIRNRLLSIGLELS